MRSDYSVYEAKAKFSEIVRRVRERGETVTVSYHGRPVAEIRPIAQSDDSIEARLDSLAERGVIVKPRGAGRFGSIARKPGALERFLEDR